MILDSANPIPNETNPFVSNNLHFEDYSHSDSGVCFSFTCPLCGDRIELATQSWWSSTCSCPRTWTLVLEAHGWLAKDNE